MSWKEKLEQLPVTLPATTPKEGEALEGQFRGATYCIVHRYFPGDGLNYVVMIHGGVRSRHILLNQLVAELGNPHTGEKTALMWSFFFDSGSTDFPVLETARVLGERIDEICQERGLSEEETQNVRDCLDTNDLLHLSLVMRAQAIGRLLLKIPDFDRREAVTAAFNELQKRWYDTHVIDALIGEAG